MLTYLQCARMPESDVLPRSATHGRVGSRTSPVPFHHQFSFFVTHRPGTSARTTSNVNASCAPIQTIGQTRPSTLSPISVRHGLRHDSLIPRQVALDVEEATRDGRRSRWAAREVRRLPNWRQHDAHRTDALGQSHDVDAESHDGRAERDDMRDPADGALARHTPSSSSARRSRPAGARSTVSTPSSSIARSVAADEGASIVVLGPRLSCRGAPLSVRTHARRSACRCARPACDHALAVCVSLLSWPTRLQSCRLQSSRW